MGTKRFYLYIGILLFTHSFALAGDFKSEYESCKAKWTGAADCKETVFSKFAQNDKIDPRYYFTLATCKRASLVPSDEVTILSALRNGVSGRDSTVLNQCLDLAAHDIITNIQPPQSDDEKVAFLSKRCAVPFDETNEKAANHALKMRNSCYQLLGSGILTSLDQATTKNLHASYSVCQLEAFNDHSSSESINTSSPVVREAICLDRMFHGNDRERLESIAHKRTGDQRFTQLTHKGTHSMGYGETVPDSAPGIGQNSGSIANLLD